PDGSRDARPGVLRAPPTPRRLLLPVPAGGVREQQAPAAHHRALRPARHESPRRPVRPRRAPPGAVTRVGGGDFTGAPSLERCSLRGATRPRDAAVASDPE